MFRVMIGLREMDYIDTFAADANLGIFLFVLFTALTTILLLNMLIAAMSDTYAKISMYLIILL